jgi:iron complex outermembrane receptor protein
MKQTMSELLDTHEQESNVWQVSGIVTNFQQMKRVIIFSLMMAVAGVAMAQKFSISGKITDDTGETLVGASVMVEGTYVGTTTNSKGEYLLSGLESGKYNLVVSFIGFEDHKEAVDLDNNKKVSVILKSKAYMSDEVIVAASRAKTNTPVAQTTLTREEVRKLNVSADIPFQLELTPSVVATSESGTGMGYTNMRIRGTDMSRINVTVNGVPLNDSESQGVYFVNMPDFTSSVNSVQVQRGVGTSTNGAASFGASVNFQTLTLEPKSYARINSTIGSFNTFKESISAGTGLINNKFAFDVRASKLNSDGYVDRGFADHQSLYLSGTYYGKKDMLKAVVMMGKEKTGITWWGISKDSLESNRTYNPAGKYIDMQGDVQFYDGQTDNYWQNHYHLMYMREINKHLTLNATAHATTGKGYYEQFIPQYDDWGSANKFEDYGLEPVRMNDTLLFLGNDTLVFPDSTIGAADMIRQKWLDNVFYGAIANLNYKKGALDATFGIAANNYEGDHFGLVKWTQFNSSIPDNYEWYNNTGNKSEVSSFLKVQYSLVESLSLYGDVQLRNISYNLSGPDDDLVKLDQSHNWLFFNPKIGLNYQLNQTNRMYLSYAMANREPARADIKEATKEGGSQLPKAETLNDFELGYELKQKTYALGLNFYYMLYDNQLVQTGERNSVGYPIMTNVKESYRTGVEFMASWMILKNLVFSGNLTYSQNKISNFVQNIDSYDENWIRTTEIRELGTTNISYSPDLISSVNLRYEPIKDFGISWMAKYVSKQYIDNTSSEERMLDAYFVNNLGLDYSFSFKKGPVANFQFLVNNILDAKYVSNAYGGVEIYQGYESTWMAYFPQAGQHYMLKIGLVF